MNRRRLCLDYVKNETNFDTSHASWHMGQCRSRPACVSARIWGLHCRLISQLDCILQDSGQKSSRSDCANFRRLFCVRRVILLTRIWISHWSWIVDKLDCIGFLFRNIWNKWVSAGRIVEKLDWFAFLFEIIWNPSVLERRIVEKLDCLAFLFGNKWQP